MRRTVLIGLLVAIPLVAIGIAISVARGYLRVRTLAIASGDPAGTYHKMATSLSMLFASDPDSRIRLAEFGYEGDRPDRPSEGAFMNLDLLSRGDVDLGFVQGGLPRKSGVRFLMNLYPATVQVIARRGLSRADGSGAVESLEDLHEGLRTSIGRPGSGTRVLAVQLLRFYQKDLVGAGGSGRAGGLAAHLFELGFQDSMIALKARPEDSGAIDVAFFVSGTGTADAIQRLVYRTDEAGRLVDRSGERIGSSTESRLEPAALEADDRVVPDLDPETGKPRYIFLRIDRHRGLSVANPHLSAVEIPRGSYTSRYSFPDVDVPTVSVYEMLCVSEKKNLDWTTVHRLVSGIWAKRALVDRVPQLASLESDQAARPLEYEPHAGASDFFDHRERWPWGLVAAVASAFVSFAGSMFSLRHLVYRKRLYADFVWLEGLEARFAGASPGEVEAWAARLDEIRARVLADFAGLKIDYLYGVDMVLQEIRRIRELLRDLPR